MMDLQEAFHAGFEAVKQYVDERLAEVESRLAAVPPGYARSLIDRDGRLVFTRTDGSTEEVGVVVGRDADMAALEAKLVQLVAAIPRPRDGVGHDDMTEELAKDGRTIVRRYMHDGETVKEFRHTFAVVLDRGVWKAGATYARGDGVTYGGSFWIAQADDAGDKPDAGGTGWRLAVKRGSPGKDAVKT